jgi:hypothetical protein
MCSECDKVETCGKCTGFDNTFSADNSANTEAIEPKVMKSIQILNNTYFIDELELREDDEWLVEMNADAFQDTRRRIICIPKGDENGPYSKVYREDLLAHEIIHALFEAIGRDGEDTEVIVELVRFMSQWFLKNKEVFKCLE